MSSIIGRRSARLVGIACALGILAFGASTPAAAAEPPQVSPEGLPLAVHTNSRLVYRAEDLDLSSYDKVAILDCTVAFAKHWQRDYNRNTAGGLDGRVRDADMTRIRERLAGKFEEVFTKVMTDAGHEIVTETGTGVLVLRPAIVNLVVNAPDLRTMGNTQSYVADPGSMTLFLELYDSLSGALLARIMDAEGASRAAPTMTFASGASNIVAADRILRSWAEELEGHLGAAHTPASR